MAFTDEQRQALNAKLRYRHVKMRASNGAQLAYVEGWHTIAEANRIFGYESWDRQTLAPRCVWQEKQRGETACFTRPRCALRCAPATSLSCARASAPVSVDRLRLRPRMTLPSRPPRRMPPSARSPPLAIPSASPSTTKTSAASPSSNGGAGRKKIQRLLALPAPLMLHHADGTTHRYGSVAEFVTVALHCVQDLPTRSRRVCFLGSQSGRPDRGFARRVGQRRRSRARHWCGAEGAAARLGRFRNEVSGLPAAKASETIDVAIADGTHAVQGHAANHPRSQRIAHPKRQAHPRSDAPRLRCRPALPRLRAAASPSTSHSLRPAACPRAQGVGRVHRAVVQRPSRFLAPDGR